MLTGMWSPGESVNRLLESLVHPTLRAEPDILYRTRVLIGLLLTMNALLLVANIINLAGGMSDSSRIVGTSLCTGLMAGNFLLLYILRVSGRYLLCSTLANLLSTLAIILGIVLSGGIRQSPASQVLIVPPLMAFFFSGIRVGVWSVLLTLALISIFLALEHAGVVFPVNVSAADISQSRMQTSFLCIVSVSMLALIFERTASRLKKERDIEHQKALTLAETDVLTGLSNRRSFDAKLGARINKHSALRDFALCYVDLDGFKPINDRFGHSVGDEVLRAIATRLQQVVRGNDVVGRQGGDEFTLIFDAPSEQSGLQQVMTRMLASISQPVKTSAGVVSVGASIGVACYPQHGKTIEELKRAADHAMYAAKQEHNQWRLAETSDAGGADGGVAHSRHR